MREPDAFLRLSNVERFSLAPSAADPSNTRDATYALKRR